MKKLFMAIIGLISFSIADIHPGLKNAIDRGDVKTAENLIKKFNVKDVYCPTGLSYEDALIIYESLFSSDPSKMWEKCDPIFVKSAEMAICKTSVPLCKYYLSRLLHNGDEEKLDIMFEDILYSKLHIQKQKKEIELFENVKASKQECLEQLEYARNKKVDSIINWYNVECKEYLDDAYCTKIFSKYGLTSIDSTNKVFSAKSKQCKKKPTKTVIKYVEKEIYVNPFLFDIEYYGILLSKRYKNPFYSNLKPLETYRALKSISDFDEKSKDNIRNVLSMDVAAFCLAFPNKRGIENQCQEAIEKYVGSINLSSDKNIVIKELSNTYAVLGFLPDSLITFSCKLYPGIDKEFFDIMDVNVFDCNVVDQYNSENEKCIASDSNYFQKFSSGIEYICDKRKWRAVKYDESKFGICSNEGDVKQNMYCAKNVGWIKNVGYKTFVDKRDNNVYRAVKIGSQIWMAENLNYKVEKSRCYDDDKENCDKYGRLYTWRSIMSENDNGCMEDAKIACFNKSLIQGICPDGWRLPTKNDFEKLISTVEKNNWSVDVKSTDGWSAEKNGINTYGFNAYPIGNWCSDGCWSEYESRRMQVYFYDKGRSTRFWNSSVNDDGYNAITLSLCNYNYCTGIEPLDLNNGASVRCLKNIKTKK